MDNKTKQKIEEFLKGKKAVLFMKGVPTAPLCGFSAKAVQILNENNIDFEHFNVLDDEEIRQGIKEFGNWPTIPQFYSNGVLIGGTDILSELHEADELVKTLSQ